MKTPFVVTIERMIPGGRGIAFHEGRPVFVPYSAPGDKILIREAQDRKSYLEAQSIEVLEPGAERSEAPCPYFGRCGGCDFQQMTYEGQLISKREILLDALKHIGKTDFPASKISLMGSPSLAYRNRVQLKVSRAGQNFSWGFFQPASHQVCAIDHCLVISEPLWNFVSLLKGTLDGMPSVTKELAGIEIFQGDENQFWVDLQIIDESMPPSLWQKLERISLSGSSPDVSLFLSSNSGKALKVSGPGYVWKTVGGVCYRVSHGSFFQVNDSMLETLRTQAVSGFSGKRALDLYCGVGFFSLALAKDFQEVLAVESNPCSGGDFQQNCIANQIRNCNLFSEEVGTFITRQERLINKLDLILIDPPRTGLPLEAVKGLASTGASDIVYVSCDPSTLARDLRVILDHQYCLQNLQVLDLFPQTHHLEAIAKLKKTTP